jgi:hypothetical protein
MKALKYLLTVIALSGALAISAKADLMFLGAVPFGPNNNPGTNQDALADFLNVDPATLTLNHNFESGLSGPVTVFPGEFFVVHYGKGKGGTTKGGSFEFFQVINNETSVTFPQSGNGVDNPDPYGHGGISSARGFNGTPTTPDSGATVMLLGGALAGLGLLGRYLKR